MDKKSIHAGSLNRTRVSSALSSNWRSMPVPSTEITIARAPECPGLPSLYSRTVPGRIMEVFGITPSMQRHQANRRHQAGNHPQEVAHITKGSPRQERGQEARAHREAQGAERRALGGQGGLARGSKGGKGGERPAKGGNGGSRRARSASKGQGGKGLTNLHQDTVD